MQMTNDMEPKRSRHQLDGRVEPLNESEAAQLGNCFIYKLSSQNNGGRQWQAC